MFAAAWLLLQALLLLLGAAEGPLRCSLLRQLQQAALEEETIITFLSQFVNIRDSRDEETVLQQVIVAARAAAAAADAASATFLNNLLHIHRKKGSAAFAALYVFNLFSVILLFLLFFLSSLIATIN